MLYSYIYICILSNDMACSIHTYNYIHTCLIFKCAGIQPRRKQSSFRQKVPKRILKIHHKCCGLLYTIQNHCQKQPQSLIRVFMFQSTPKTAKYMHKNTHKKALIPSSFPAPFPCGIMKRARLSGRLVAQGTGGFGWCAEPLIQAPGGQGSLWETNQNFMQQLLTGNPMATFKIAHLLLVWFHQNLVNWMTPVCCLPVGRALTAGSIFGDVCWMVMLKVRGFVEVGSWALSQKTRTLKLSGGAGFMGCIV